MDSQESAIINAPTVQEILGLPHGCRAVLQRTIADHVLHIVAAKRPEVAAALEALDGRSVVVIAVDDVVELQLDGPIPIGVGCDNVIVRFSRSTNGLFGLSVSGAGLPPLIHQVTELTVSREGEAFVLAEGEPRVKVTRGDGTVHLELYTAPFLTHVSAMVRMFAPNTVGLFRLTVTANPCASSKHDGL